MKIKTLFPTVAILAFVGGAAASLAETPKPSERERQQAVAAIERYVREDAAIKGSFLIVDPRSAQPLALTFDHVHSGVKPDGEGYLACVDFKDTRGRLYDVDVVVKLDGESAKVQAVRLHKVEGQSIAAEPK